MSLDALTGAVTGRPLVAVVLAYAVFPYAILWLAVRLWPADHPRRSELLAEYDSVDWWKRPLWVGDVAIRCLLDGLAARRRANGRAGTEARRRIVTFTQLLGGASLGVWMGALSDGHPWTVAGPLFVLALGPITAVIFWMERRLQR